MRGAIAAVALALGACGGRSNGTPDGAPDLDTPPAVDARPTPAFPARITVPASQGVVALPFDTTITGKGGAPIGDVAVTHDVGTVALDGAAVAAFTYEQQPFGAYTLYQGVAVSAARWDVFWLYCNGNALAYVYDEGVDGPPIFFTGATGACNVANTSVQAQVSLPAMSIPAPVPSGGYTVDGPKIVVHHDGTGAVTIGGKELPLIVFGDVDCRTECGGSGWSELHSVVWDEAAQRAMFVIIYLRKDAPSTVLLTYARSLPDLGDPIGILELDATWSVSALRRARDYGPVHPGMPPPR